MRCIIRIALFLSVCFVLACGAGSSHGDAAVAAGLDSVPVSDAWKNNMLIFGEQHWQKFYSRYKRVNELKKIKPDWKNSDEYNHALADSYYDFAFVLYQIAEFTGDSKWKDRAKVAAAFWREDYVLPSGNIQGYWNFTHGLTADFQKSGIAASKDAAILQSKNAAYARDGSTGSDRIESPERSREIAYAIVSYLDAEKLGAPRRSRLASLVAIALGHLDQWTGKADWINTPDIARTRYVRPFMMALTARALIQYADQTGDAKILPALTSAADWLWDNMWRKESEAFAYTDRIVEDPNDKNAAPDLNLLIAPWFGWLYSKTGEIRFQERGDQIFAGGVKKAYLSGDFAKQFNQSYLWSFDYVKWRGSR